MNEYKDNSFTGKDLVDFFFFFLDKHIMGKNNINTQTNTHLKKKQVYILNLSLKKNRFSMALFFVDFKEKTLRIIIIDK